MISTLRDGHAVDFDIERAGPLRDAEEYSGRRVLGEVAFVYLVEGLEALGGYAEHVALQHVIEVRPRRLQRCLHLFEDALGLALERGMLQEFAGVRVEGRHAGHEHHVPSSGADRDGSAPFLKIGAERFDADDLSFHGLPRLRSLQMINSTTTSFARGLCCASQQFDRQCRRWVKPGKAHPEQMSSALHPITDSTRTSRLVSNVPKKGLMHCT